MKPRFDYTFVTYSGLPDLDPDDRAVADWLEDRGVRVGVAIWNDPSVVWNEMGVCVLRSTWDYHLDVVGFRNWLERVSSYTRVLNPLPMVLWNIEKSYLLELAQMGIPVVPTLLLNSSRELKEVDLSPLGQDIVVKPLVGLATSGVKRFTGSDAQAKSRGYAETLLSTGGALLQPYLRSVETTGERALVFIDGIYSHAIQKIPFQNLAAAGLAGEKVVEPTEGELACARQALAVLPEPTLYARVDVVNDDGGRPVLMELELVEPSLYCKMYPRAVERFGAALKRWFDRNKPLGELARMHNSTVLRG